MWSTLKNLIGLSEKRGQRAIDLLQLAIEEISEALRIQQLAKAQAQNQERAFTERLQQEEQAFADWEAQVRAAIGSGNRSEAKRLLAKESYWKLRLEQMRKVQQQTLNTWQKLAQQEQQLQYKLDSCQAWMPLLKAKPNNEELQQEVQNFLTQLDTDGLFQELALQDGLPPDPIDAEIEQALEGTPDSQLDAWQDRLKEEAEQKRRRAEAERLAVAEKRLQQVQAQFGTPKTTASSNPEELLKAFMEQGRQQREQVPNHKEEGRKKIDVEAFFEQAPTPAESADEQLQRWMKEQELKNVKTENKPNPSVSKEQEEEFRRFFGD